MWPRHINYSKTHETDPPRQALFGANVSEVTDRGSVWAMTLLHEFTGRSFKWIEMPNRGEKSNTLVRTILNILTSLLLKDTSPKRKYYQHHVVLFTNHFRHHPPNVF